MYSVAFEHRKTGDRICLNEANYVAVNYMKLGIAPIVVEKIGLSEYVFFNLKPLFPTKVGSTKTIYMEPVLKLFACSIGIG